MTLYDPFGVSSLCLPTPSISNKTITLTTVDFQDQRSKLKYGICIVGFGV